MRIYHNPSHHHHKQFRGIELGRASVKFFWFYYSWRQANERKFGYIAKRKV